MGLYTVIFIVASIYQYEFYEEGVRRVVSFALFMTMFTYMFIKIDSEMIASFKHAIVLVSVLLSISSIVVFFSAGGVDLDFEPAKNLVGSQRVGFVYLLALWLIYLNQRPESLHWLTKIAILTILSAGLLLTFSRSSIVALVVSMGLFAAESSLKWLRRPTVRTLWKGALSILGVGVLAVLLYELLPLAFNFFDARLVEYLLDPQAISEDLGNPQSTGGNRVFLLRDILDFTLHNPLTGSGYLGVWVAYGYQSGSAHSQYTDVLFRTGIVGFLAYGYVLFLLGRHLYRSDRSLFWGFLAVIVYGMFNETFKESHGTFVLAFFLGMMSQVRLLKRGTFKAAVRVQ
jgi:O-antigen ligase